jgi:regulator of sigma D
LTQQTETANFSSGIENLKKKRKTKQGMRSTVSKQIHYHFTYFDCFLGNQTDKEKCIENRKELGFLREAIRRRWMKKRPLLLLLFWSRTLVD